jgi:hypothetical protein
MTYALFVVACIFAAAGQPLIACLVSLAAVASAGRGRLHF